MPAPLHGNIAAQWATYSKWPTTLTTILYSPSLHFNLESIVRLSDIALALRHAHGIAWINRSFPSFFLSFFSIFFARQGVIYVSLITLG